MSSYLEDRGHVFDSPLSYHFAREETLRNSRSRGAVGMEEMKGALTGHPDSPGTSASARERAQSLVRKTVRSLQGTLSIRILGMHLALVGSVHGGSAEG